MVDSLSREELLGVMRETVGAIPPGEAANYIPALARVPTNRFGLSVCRPGGEQVSAGDADVPFSLQSIAKLFSTALAMRMVGDELWKRVGVLPSGSPFHALLQPELEGRIPRNPFVNAGALVVVDALLSAGLDPVEDLLQLLRELVGTGTREIAINASVADSERMTASRTRALSHLLHSHGFIDKDPEEVLANYVMQCAVELTVEQAARASTFLAVRGKDPHTGREWLAPNQTKRMLGLMLTCGAYQSSVDFSFRIGFPCKSGVGGGIVGVVPGVASMAVWSPGLDAAGNSTRGAAVLERLSSRWRLSVLEGKMRGADGPSGDCTVDGARAPWGSADRTH